MSIRGKEAIKLLYDRAANIDADLILLTQRIKAANRAIKSLGHEKIAIEEAIEILEAKEKEGETNHG